MKLYKIDYHTWVKTDIYVFLNPGILYYEAESILEAQQKFRNYKDDEYHIDAITEIKDKEIMDAKS